MSRTSAECQSLIDNRQTPATATPHTILDAGGDRGTRLTVGLHRLLDVLFEGETLEVISRNVATQIEIPLWCARTGHGFQIVRLDADESVFWITKIMSSHR